MGVNSVTLDPYLDETVSALLAMLGPTSKKFAQEQAITTLAMVADAAELRFSQYYSSIMPNLLSVLRTTEPGLRSLRCKVMECAGLIAFAVGKDVFEPDANELAGLLMQIQDSVVESDDQTANYLVLTWAKLCRVLGPAFEPYLPFVMPPLLRSAAIKADVTIMNDEDNPSENDGWEVIEMGGQQVGIRTAYLEEKCAAFDTMVTYCAVLGAKFAPYLPQALELAIPCLNFVFHDGVREACAQLIPILLVCGKESQTLAPAMVDAVYERLVRAISVESDAGFLASLIKCFTDSLRVLKIESISPVYIEGGLKAIGQQLHLLAQRRKERSSRIRGKDWEEEREDLLLIEEMEDFALFEVEGLLKFLDPHHPLLFALSSIRDLALPVDRTWDEEAG
jgi:hypothetical protein